MSRMERLFDKIENDTLINVIRSGFIGVIPFLLIGSCSLMLSEIPYKPYQNFIDTFLGGRIGVLFDSLYDYTLGLLSLILIVSISYYYGKYYNSRERHMCPIISLVCYMVFVGMQVQPEELDATIFSTSWTLTSVIVALTASALFNAIMNRVYNHFGKNAIIRGEGSIKFVYMILPAAGTIATFAVISMLWAGLMGETFSSQNIFAELSVKLFDNMGRNLGSSILFMWMIHIMWMFGVHGSNVMEAVATTLFQDKAGEVFTKTFFDSFVLMGGAGSTICLLIAILIFSKHKGRRRLAKASALPVLVNVNETITFGLPIIFNPIMLVPFTLTPIVLLLASTLAVNLGVIPPVIEDISWTTPPIISGYLATGTIMGSIVQIVNIAIGVFIYLPFVKIMDRPNYAVVRENIDALTDHVKQMEEVGVIPTLTRGRKPINKAARKLTEDMHTAIEAGHVTLFYQPQVDKNNRIIGIEGLLRWYHPACGYIYPPLILYLANEDEYLHELELLVINRACQDAKRFSDEGLKNLKISVNISAMQLDDPRFYEDVERNLGKHDLGDASLYFEITERVALSNNSRVTEGLKMLSNKGIGIIMDDFGMGHSSMSYLQKNKFDYVKLDGSLVRDIETNIRSQEIIRTICQLSQKLDFDVVAEYVETEEQRDILASLGCTIYQGYLYGKAMPFGELIEWSRDYV